MDAGANRVSERQMREIMRLQAALRQIAKMDPDWSAAAAVEVASKALADQVDTL